jgi:hypothetical protein
MSLRVDVVKDTQLVFRCTKCKDAKPTKRFPVQDGPSIPWAMIEPHEKQCMANHSQTLKRLSQRGGLSPSEVLAVLDDENWMKSQWGNFTTDWTTRNSHPKVLAAKAELEKRRAAFEDKSLEIQKLLETINEIAFDIDGVRGQDIRGISSKALFILCGDPPPEKLQWEKKPDVINLDADPFYVTTPPEGVSFENHIQTFGFFLTALQAKVWERVVSYQPDEVYVALDVLALIERLEGYESIVESLIASTSVVKKAKLKRHGLTVFVDLRMEASTGKLSCSQLGYEGVIEFRIKD